MGTIPAASRALVASENGVGSMGRCRSYDRKDIAGGSGSRFIPEIVIVRAVAVSQLRLRRDRSSTVEKLAKWVADRRVGVFRRRPVHSRRNRQFVEVRSWRRWSGIADADPVLSRLAPRGKDVVNQRVAAATSANDPRPHEEEGHNYASVASHW